jgi:hypothetical protein
MTRQEVYDYIVAQLAVPVTLVEKFLNSFSKVLDFITESTVTAIIPDWLSTLTFNTDGTGDGKYCLHPDTNGKKRIFETKTNANINNVPPTDPAITENTYWKEISQSAGSSIKEWAPGLYGEGYIIVGLNHSVHGRGLALLLDPVRPFNSTNIETEMAAGKWEFIAISKAYVDAQGSSGAVDTANHLFDDFHAVVQYLGLSAFNNGGGLGLNPSTSSFGVDATEKANGVLLLSTGSSTAGGSALNNTTYKLTFGFGYSFKQAWRAALKDLSDATDTFIARLGFMESFTATPGNGAYFRYTHSVNGGKWEAVTVSGGIETAEDTGILADVSVFHTFKIEVNDAATQVDFYIDGVKTNDITTNIINSGANLTAYNCAIQKTAGSTAKGMYVDYFELLTTRTTAR